MRVAVGVYYTGIQDYLKSCMFEQSFAVSYYKNPLDGDPKEPKQETWTKGIAGKLSEKTLRVEMYPLYLRVGPAAQLFRNHDMLQAIFVSARHRIWYFNSAATSKKSSLQEGYYL